MTFSMISEWHLVVVSVALLSDLLQTLATCVRHTDETHDERDSKEGYHAVSCDGKAFAIFSIDVCEYQSPDGRKTTYDEEHETLSASAELGWE